MPQSIPIQTMACWEFKLMGAYPIGTGKIDSEPVIALESEVHTTVSHAG
jgi:hypothetical protein